MKCPRCQRLDTVSGPWVPVWQPVAPAKDPPEIESIQAKRLWSCLSCNHHWTQNWSEPS